MWLYKSEQITSLEQVPEGSLGFIYLMTHIASGKKYIGRKLLYSKKSKIVNGKKKSIQKESDWMSYYSSSPTIKKMIDEEGTEAFTREILIFCEKKGELVYAEENLLHFHNALTSANYFNDNIRAKIYRSWVKSEKFIEDLLVYKTVHE